MSLEILAQAITEGGVLCSDVHTRGRSQSQPGGGVQNHCSTRTAGSTSMDDRDKRIYNSLGDTSGPKGKVR